MAKEEMESVILNFSPRNNKVFFDKPGPDLEGLEKISFPQAVKSFVNSHPFSPKKTTGGEAFKKIRYKRSLQQLRKGKNVAIEVIHVDPRLKPHMYRLNQYFIPPQKSRTSKTPKKRFRKFVGGLILSFKRTLRK